MAYQMSPFGFDPNASPAYAGNGNPFNGPKGFSTNQGLQGLIGSGYSGGAYNATGEGSYLDAMRSYLNQVGAGNVRQAQLSAQLHDSGDPYADSYARLTAEQHARDNTQMELGQAQAGAAGQNRDFLHQLLMQYMQPTLQRRQRTDWGAVGGQLLGTLGGAAIGAIGGPAGMAAGAAAGAAKKP